MVSDGAERAREPDDLEAREWYDHKSALMESTLGSEHGIVMHSIIPYDAGGALDLYYYPNGLPGTAIATKELSPSASHGPSNEVYRCYELAMFTKQPLRLDDASDESTPFGKAHASLSAMLNCIARYSAEATLNPGETCEFPSDMERIGSTGSRPTPITSSKGLGCWRSSRCFGRKWISPDDVGVLRSSRASRPTSATHIRTLTGIP